MTNLQKALSFWVGLVFVIILGVFLLVSINQKMNTMATNNTVSFSGEGKVLAKPDVAVIDFSIVTEALTSKVAQDSNSAKSKKVIDFLKSQKIAEKDIKTSSYNIYPQYSYLQNRKPEITGYQVSETIEVKIRNLDQVSDVLSGVVTAGANQVNSTQFTIDNPEKLKAQARDAAIADAKTKAKDLESKLGISLGHIVNFSEGTNGYPVPMMYDKAAVSGMGGGGGPAISTGQNEITVDVTITYQIK